MFGFGRKKMSATSQVKNGVESSTKVAASNELIVDTNCTVAVDVETSGLNAKVDRILQWGISVHNRKLGIISTASAYLNHDIDIPQQASQVNGLTRQLLAERGVDPEQAIGVLLQYLSKAGRVIAYNAPFDAKFLRAEVDRLGIYIEVPHIECTMQHAMRSNLPGLSRYRLIDVVEWFNQIQDETQIPLNAHDAGSDAAACLFVQTALDAYAPS